ncbi:hypothetical protein HHO41_13235 [Bacillus sp. DNRA2]|uniref:hypothetical protein n=1 Tax=Bacillus sp. DNRA2 TaxID=2723053 RepID=UPI00145EA957|nr:hypothetical protein [Bacillus sp. DNRA2]NMD71262.1 hypothetical protein [Bacillus sp. DNRA2]
MSFFRNIKDKLVDLKDEAEYKMMEWEVDEKVKNIKDKVVDKVDDLKIEAEIMVDDLKEKVGQKANKEEQTYVILEDMDEQVKINYLKIIVNLCNVDEDMDQKELVEIYSLMGQLKFDVQQRMEIRNYITMTDQDIHSLLGEMDTEIPEGSEEVLHLSLLKDCIRISKASINGLAETQRNFIHSIARIYSVSDDKISFLEEACELEGKILNGQISDSEITKNIKDMAAKGGAVGVPIAAVYLSGTAGVSAVGITSGLATLGLGGLFGLSAMVTGIGVAVLIGVGTYKTVKWATGGSEREKANKREFLLKEAILNSQNTINYLIEDINYFTSQVIEIAEESQLNKARLTKVVKEIKILKDALTTMRGREIQLQKGFQHEEA